MTTVPAATRDAAPHLAEAGIHVLPLPNPFGPGPTNAYLVEDDPLTLVDCGANWAVALDALAAGLEQRGHRIRDLQLIVITHPHKDHLGLASVLVGRSGAEVAALASSRPHVEAFEEETIAENAFIERVMVRHGVAPAVAAALRTGAALDASWGSSARVTMPLRDGEAIRLANRTLDVLHRPGHTPYDTVLVDRRHSVAFSGDHLLQDIAACALISRPEGAPHDYVGPSARALLDLRRSLAATRGLDVQLVLGGHGPPIDDLVSLVDARLAEHLRRVERIAGALEGHSLTAYEIAVALWREGAATGTFLTLSQVLGHLELMLELDAVRTDVSETVVRWS